MSIEAAAEIIRHDAGPQFDPQVVDAFERALPAIRTIYEQQSETILNGE